MAGEGAGMWGGRFSGSVDPVMMAFNASITYDNTMWRQDLQGSQAYARALVCAGLLTLDECEAIEGGLASIRDEWESGRFVIDPQDEDIHSANERRLKEMIGDVGGKVHTGRSRNDQVAVDMRLWLKHHLTQATTHLAALITVLVDRGERETHILMPGYTHLQRAQPIRWSHWLLSHAWPLLTDLTRAREVYRRVDVCPLGSGALAGNPFTIDRAALAKDLGFAAVTDNSLNAVGDRDFVCEYLFWCNLVGSHLSRLAEDLILYSSSEFGFVRLSDAYATGSSLMPQKRNPDSMELIRGKAATLQGNLCGFLAVLKGLPSTYNKDLQDDKVKMFEAADTLSGVLQVAAGALATMQVFEGKCRGALTEDMLATDLAYYLVRKGMAFRSAHGLAGAVVKRSEELGCSLSQVPLSQLQQISPLFSEDVSAVWDFEHSVEQYTAVGGTALASVTAQLAKARALLNNFTLHTPQPSAQDATPSAQDTPPKA